MCSEIIITTSVASYTKLKQRIKYEQNEKRIVRRIEI